jgi:hypothetical protein
MSLSKKDPAVPGAEALWFRLGGGALDYQEAVVPPEGGGARQTRGGSRRGQAGESTEHCAGLNRS